jgi:microcystin-dependent protein
MISAFASSAAPSGWLECNGQAVSRSTYSKLYSSIGTTFGAGDGSTTFNIPDLRGEFIRGWSHGRSGVDDGRTVGSFQDQSIQSHAHSYTFTDVIYSNGESSGTGASKCREESATTGYAGGAETRPRNVALMYCIKY